MVLSLLVFSETPAQQWGTWVLLSNGVLLCGTDTDGQVLSDLSTIGETCTPGHTQWKTYENIIICFHWLIFDQNDY